jgi:membrane protein DedA with SNARE-associated domain
MSAYFSKIIDLVGAYPQYAIVAIFLLAWSEAIPVLGTIVPGSTLIIAISALAAGADVSAIYLVLAAIAGAVAGDALAFWIGHRYHQAALLIWPLKRYPQLIERSKAFIHKYGIASVFLARFTAIVRAFVPLVAGVLRMPSGKFYAANIASALVWGPLHVFPGVLAAFVLSILGAGRAQLFPIIVTAVVLLSAGSGFMHGWAQKRPGRLLPLSLGGWPLARPWTRRWFEMWLPPGEGDKAGRNLRSEEARGQSDARDQN